MNQPSGQTSNSRNPTVVALTGTIGSGKSTVLEIFRTLGAHVLSADLLAREAVAPGSSTLHKLVSHFGPEVLRPDGSLDRARVSSIVFSNPDQRKLLEAIVHPEVRRRFLDRLAEIESSDPRDDLVVVYEVPLLFESKNTYPEISKVIAVSARAETCIDRIVARDHGSREDAARKLAAQLSDKEKCARADIVIQNEGSLDSLKSQVVQVFQSLSTAPRPAH